MRELLLLPFEGTEQNQYSYTVLRLCGFDLSDVNSKLYKSLVKLTEKAKENKQFVPDRFSSYKDIEINKDIVYLFAKDLLELETLHKEYYKDNDPEDINKEKALATMSYIKTLLKNRKITLYWR